MKKFIIERDIPAVDRLNAAELQQAASAVSRRGRASRRMVISLGTWRIPTLEPA